MRTDAYAPKSPAVPDLEVMRRIWSRTDRPMREGPHACWTYNPTRTDEFTAYPVIDIEGGKEQVRRVVFGVYRGDPGDRQIYNDCGRHDCINPDHLSFKKPPQKATRGEGHPMARLDEDDVREIRTMIERGVTQKEIARRKRVSKTTISDIKREKRWGWLA